MNELNTRKPACCVVLHDVAPTQWPLYESMVEKLDRMGSIPLTLLVVPDFHHLGSIENDTGFLAAMEDRLTRGDELVLHGFYHDDPGPVPIRPREYFMRRIYTHEGEFYRISKSEAVRRLDRGLELFARLGWPVHGFVAPAWLTDPAIKSVLTDLPLAYTSDPGGLIILPAYRHISAPTLVWSAGSSWRRLLSLIWNTYRLEHHSGTALVRLGLHPVDMQYQSVRRYWLRTLAGLLEYRTPVTKRQWLEEGII